MHYNHILDKLIYKLKEDLENESGLEIETQINLQHLEIDDEVVDRDENFTNWNELKWMDGDLNEYIGKSLWQLKRQP